MKEFRFRAATLLVSLASVSALVGVACSSNSTPVTAGDAGPAAGCENAPVLTKDDYCKSCTVAANATPNTCKPPRVINACCTYVQAPTQEVARGVGLHRFSTNSDPVVNLGCLDTPPPQGAPQTVSMKGFVRLFSSGSDTANVKIEVYKEGPDGALGELIGTPFTTTNDDATDPPLTPKETWLKKCENTPCSFRSYTYAGVPTETPLIVKTSDASGGGQWAALYDYNIYLYNSVVKPDSTIDLDLQAVASTDINTVAAAAGGVAVRPDRGLLAGEVHDCDNIRLSGATVDTDVAHEGDMFYFGENEADPLPDRQRSSLGTSKLGLFGALNIPTGTPIRLRAVGKYKGETVLVGSHVVQTFPGAVTALALRGRRPYQK